LFRTTPSGEIHVFRRLSRIRRSGCGIASVKPLWSNDKSQFTNETIEPFPGSANPFDDLRVELAQLHLPPAVQVTQTVVIQPEQSKHRDVDIPQRMDNLAAADLMVASTMPGFTSPPANHIVIPFGL